jgi:GT2 family glycosyltransferase
MSDLIEVLLVVNGKNPPKTEFEGLRTVFEPEMGYSKVRNAALTASGNIDGLIFIDDDEIPTKDWLENLLLAHKNYPNDVLIGPVYPDESTAQQNSFRSKSFSQFTGLRDGDIIDQGGTGNMLIPRKALESKYCYFDPYFNLGSEDTDFCFRLRSYGFSVRFIASAVLFESEDLRKIDSDYILERSIRDEINYNLILRRNCSLKVVGIRILKLQVRIFQHFSRFLLLDRKNRRYKVYTAGLRALLVGRRPDSVLPK